MTSDAAALIARMDHQTIHCDQHAYSAHPHLAVAANDNWLLVFTQSRRRAGVLHPPQDPLYCNMLMRSADEGRSWSAPSVVPGFGWQGVECAGLTPLRSGVLLLNQWRFDWHTLAHARAYLAPDAYAGPEQLMGAEAMAAELQDWTPQKTALAERYPWARGGGQTWVHRSLDGGNTFTASTRIDTTPFSGGYGMRGGIEVDGEILLPLSDVPNYASVFTVRSGDGGQSWSEPRLVATGEGHAFEEPAPILLRDGRIVMLLRDNVSRILHVVSSEDGGFSWSAPSPTGIADYPADMVGTRRRPYRLRRRKTARALRHCALHLPRQGKQLEFGQSIHGPLRPSQSGSGLSIAGAARRWQPLRRVLRAGFPRHHRHPWQRSHARR